MICWVVVKFIKISNKLKIWKWKVFYNWKKKVKVNFILIILLYKKDFFLVLKCLNIFFIFKVVDFNY